MSNPVDQKKSRNWATSSLDYLANRPIILHFVRSRNDERSLKKMKASEEWAALLHSCVFQKGEHPLLSRAEHIKEIAQHVKLEHKIPFIEKMSIAKLPEFSSLIEILHQTLSPEEIGPFIDTLVKLEETNNTTFSQILDRVDIKKFLLHCLSSPKLLPHLKEPFLVECMKKIPPNECFPFFESCLYIPSVSEFPIFFWKALFNRWHIEPETTLREFLAQYNTISAMTEVGTLNNVWEALKELLNPADMELEKKDAFLEQCLLPSLEKILVENQRLNGFWEVWARALKPVHWATLYKNSLQRHFEIRESLWPLALQNRDIISNLLFLYGIKTVCKTTEIHYDQLPLYAREALMKNITSFPVRNRLQTMAQIGYINELPEAFWIDAFCDIPKENLFVFLRDVVSSPFAEKLGFTFWKTFCDLLSGESYIQFSKIIVTLPLESPVFIAGMKAILLHKEARSIPENIWEHIIWHRDPSKLVRALENTIVDIISHKDAENIPSSFWKTLLSHDLEAPLLRCLPSKLQMQKDVATRTTILINFWSTFHEQKQQESLVALAQFLSFHDNSTYEYTYRTQPKREIYDFITKDFCRFLLDRWDMQKIAAVISKMTRTYSPMAQLFIDAIKDVYSKEQCRALLQLLPLEKTPMYERTSMLDLYKKMLSKFCLEESFSILSRIHNIEPTYYIHSSLDHYQYTAEEISTFLHNMIATKPQKAPIEPFFFLFFRENLAYLAAFENTVFPWEQIVERMEHPEVCNFLHSIISEPIYHYRLPNGFLPAFFSKLNKEDLTQLFKNSRSPNFGSFLENCYKSFEIKELHSILELHLEKTREDSLAHTYNMEAFLYLSMRVLRFSDLIPFLQSMQSQMSVNLAKATWYRLEHSFDMSGKPLFQKNTVKESLQFVVDLHRLSPLPEGCSYKVRRFLTFVISSASPEDITATLVSLQGQEIDFLLSLLIPIVPREQFVPLLESILSQQTLNKHINIELLNPRIYGYDPEKFLETYIYQAPPLVKEFIEQHLPHLLLMLNRHNIGPRQIIWSTISAEKVIAALEVSSEEEIIHLLKMLTQSCDRNILTKWLSLMLGKKTLKKHITFPLLKEGLFSEYRETPRNRFFSFLQIIKQYPNLQIFLADCLSEYMTQAQNRFDFLPQVNQIIGAIEWGALDPSTQAKTLSVLFSFVKINNELLLYFLSQVHIRALTPLFSEAFFEYCDPQGLINDLQGISPTVWEGPLFLAAYYLNRLAKKRGQNLSFSSMPILSAKCLRYGKFIPPATFPSHLTSPTQYIPPGPERENNPFFQFLSHLPKWISTRWVTLDTSDFPKKDPDNGFLHMEAKPKEMPEAMYIQQQIQKSIESFVKKILDNEHIHLSSEDPVQRDKDYQEFVLKPLYHAMDQVMKTGSQEKARQILITIAQSEQYCLVRYKNMAKQIYEFTTEATTIIPQESSDFENELYILAQGMRERCYNQTFTPTILDQIILLVLANEQGEEELAPLFFNGQRLLDINNVHAQHRVHQIQSRLGVIKYELELQEDDCTRIDEEKYLESQNVFYQRYNQLAFFDAVMEKLTPDSEMEMRLEAYLKSHTPAEFDPNGPDVPEDLRPGNEPDPTGAFRKAAYVSSFKDSSAKWDPQKIQELLIPLGFLG